jgi:hypothetical protein
MNLLSVLFSPFITLATLYYKNTAFIWWERLPAANIAFAPCCHSLSRLEAAPTKVDNPVNPKVSP